MNSDRDKKGRFIKGSKVNTTHGLVRTPTYYSWMNMKKRCLSKNYHRYPDYGGRGITVCKEWMDFSGFLKDMGIRPVGRTLDRIDNNGSYTKENCRWSTIAEQNSNTRVSNKIPFRGESHNLKEWCIILGLPFRKTHSRYYRRWPLAKVFEQ